MATNSPCSTDRLMSRSTSVRAVLEPYPLVTCLSSRKAISPWVGPRLSEPQQPRIGYACSKQCEISLVLESGGSESRGPAMIVGDGSRSFKPAFGDAHEAVENESHD